MKLSFLLGWQIDLLVLLLGLVVGSFLNVVILRLPLGRSLIRPASHCPRCRVKIRWYDNIPLISFLILLGKCRFCKKSISPRYPIVELITATVFYATYVKFGWSALLWVHHFPFVAILVAVTFIDLDHRIIPDVLSLGGLVLGLLTCWWVPGLGWFSSFTGAALGFGVFYALAWAYEKKAGRSGLGGGDIKLLAMVGAFLGPEGAFATIFISSVLGSLFGISYALLNRKADMMKLSIPYGPFIVVGAIYFHLLGDILWFRFMIPI